MPKLTKKAICKEVTERTGLECELHKTEGFYYWGGKAAMFFDECWTGLQWLDQAPLECWVGDFESRVEKCERLGDSLKEMAEKTNWDISKRDDPTVLKVSYRRSPK